MTGQPTEQRTVTCFACEHPNPAETRRCERCGKQLYIICNDCGQKNERSRWECTKCGHRLHRTLLRRLRRKLLPKDSKIKPLEIGLLIIAVWVTYKIIVFIAERGGEVRIQP